VVELSTAEALQVQLKKRLKTLKACSRALTDQEDHAETSQPA